MLASFLSHAGLFACLFANRVGLLLDFLKDVVTTFFIF